MPTVCLTITATPMDQEVLIAELDELGFDAFEPGAVELRAYGPAEHWIQHAEAVRAQLHRLDRGTLVAVDHLDDQNWNARWEASIRPLAVGAFLIRPSWQPIPPEHADRIPLTIDPKMSFGTGYHESTRLVLRALPALVRPGARVLDAGTGTGILGIAAAKLGAASVFAFDIDAWATENVPENVTRNGVEDRVVFRQGSLEVAPPGPYDLVLANINRAVLIDLLPAFAAACAPTGQVVLAGLLQTDEPAMAAPIAEAGLRTVAARTEGAWWSVTLEPW
ncbi:MAG: 50S ribosomal protein L11 methyltransferase [Bacteroidota bacterium]